MSTLTFRDLRFSKQDGKVIITFYNIFYTELSEKDLESIGHFSIKGGTITFDNATENRASKKFNMLLEKSLINLRSKIGNKRAYYIHKNSGIPLIGTNYFGIIDRDTNVIEVKPFTGCNYNCIYCSVDEGVLSKRKTDYVVEEEYLFDEFKKLVILKGIDNIDAHINAQGETTLYSQLVKLVEDISSLEQVKTISIDTNGSMLTKDFIDKLAEAGLTRINLSLNAIDETVADNIAGNRVNIPRLLDTAKYIVSKIDLIIAPVWLPGINDDELHKIANFAVEIGAGKNCPPIGIQNFLWYPKGRNPVKEKSFKEFYDKMRDIEGKHKIKLIYEQGFGIISCKKLKKPFKRNQIIEAEIVLPGRFKGEMLAKSNGRLISIHNCSNEGKIRVRIKRTKHNIFNGEIA